MVEKHLEILVDPVLVIGYGIVKCLVNLLLRQSLDIVEALFSEEG